MSASAFDSSALAEYLRAEGLIGTGQLEISQLSGGQSNPTYRLSAGHWQAVLRTKPPGVLLSSAHAIDREYRVMQALKPCGIPVPKMLTYCKDLAILGREFYLMEFMEGRVFVDQSLPGLSRAERAAMYDDMNHVIAALHAVQPSTAGLSDYGKAGSYFERQVSRWSRQCRESAGALPQAMLSLMDWLPQNIPAGDETTVVHGDFRMDNLVFHPKEPRVIAVLDWELSTLGHPLADFSYQCLSWHIPASLWRGVAGLELETLGIPDEKSYVARYLQRTGRALDGPWNFYIAYNLFRIAAILHGIGERARAGNAAAADAMENAARVQPLAEIGWAVAQGNTL